MKNKLKKRLAWLMMIKNDINLKVAFDYAYMLYYLFLMLCDCIHSGKSFKLRFDIFQESKRIRMRLLWERRLLPIMIFYDFIHDSFSL